MLHLIPDDGRPHAPTTECGCGPQLIYDRGRAVAIHADTDGWFYGLSDDRLDDGEDDDGWA